MSDRPTITCHVQAYLAHRRALGFALKCPGRLLMDFARFVDQLGHGKVLTTELALQWAILPPGASKRYQAYRLSAVRGFARYLAARDDRTQIPPSQLLGRCVRRIQPHIYSDDQIGQLLTAATELPPAHAMRPKTYNTLLGLLNCTGLRISEALALSRADVDLQHGILHIRQTKFSKSRMVPLHPSATRAMVRYARARDRAWPTPRSHDFFVSNQGRAPAHVTVGGTFRTLCNRLGLSGNGTRPQPRIHDLRHTFACRRLLAWYEQGVDVDHAITALSTYLGHTSIANTYWYLTGVPQLMGIASARFERLAAPRNRRSLCSMTMPKCVADCSARRCRSTSVSSSSINATSAHAPSAPTAIASSCLFASWNSIAASKPNRCTWLIWMPPTSSRSWRVWSVSATTLPEAVTPDWPRSGRSCGTRHRLTRYCCRWPNACVRSPPSDSRPRVSDTSHASRCRHCWMRRTPRHAAACVTVHCCY